MNMNPSKNKMLQMMIVDNDPHVRGSLKVFFKDSDLPFLIFKTAHEGLNALEYQDIDIVVSDYFLPDMDGLKFLKTVKQRYPNIKRILMATLSGADLRQELEEEKIEGFIEKPLTVGFLENIIRGIIPSIT
jgi:DNA-binding NtrC family response regulator